MKGIKKLLSVLLVFTMTFAVAGCNIGKGGKEKDYGNTTVLRITAHPGGPGATYFEQPSSAYGGKSMVQAFQEKYANVSFEEGKMGVSVDVTPLDNGKPEQILPTINSGNGADIYYSYNRVEKEMARQSIYANITDLMNEKVYTEDGELAEGTFDPQTGEYTWTGTQPTKSIADKMTNYKEELYLTDPTGQLYAEGEGFYSIPYEDSLVGFIVDYDLFSEKGWNDYNGVDGFPDTIEDFFDLMSRILDAGMIPFTACRGTGGYWISFINAFIHQVEGDQCESGWTYSGEVKFPKSAFEGTSVNPTAEGMTETDDGASYKVTITPRNAWLLNYLPGVTKCVEFMRDIVQQDNVNYQVYNTQYDFLTCQQTFIMSKTGRVQRTPRIAMIFEGEWFENEARSVFSNSKVGLFGTRDFRMMPIPKINGQIDASVRSIASIMHGDNLFVNAKTNKRDLCRLWLQFTHSQSGLATYNMLTGLGRPFDYTLDDAQLASMSKFAQNCHKIRHGIGEYSSISVYAYKSYGEGCEYYQTKQLGGMGHRTFYSTLAGSTGYEQLFTYFLAHSRADYVTAQQFIDGMRSFNSKSAWEAQYDSWLSLKN